MDASTDFQNSLPVSSDALLAQLDDWGIEYKLHQHVPLRTVADAKTVEAEISGGQAGAFHVKNLYLRDKKKRNHLVTLEQDREIDLKALGANLGVGNLSFGSADRLMDHLGIRPGAVSPLAMVTGQKQGVTFYLDRAAQDADMIYMHPLVNDRTVAMRPEALLTVLDRIGASVTWLDL